MFRQLTADVREMVTEQGQYRDLLYEMTLRDLRLRYKQTIMGFGWAVFTPLLNTAIFTIIFTRVAPIETPVPYVVFAYCGLLTWNYFASALKFGALSLASNVSLVTKVYFPREIFPVSAVFVSAVDFAVGAILLVAMMVYYGIVPGPALLLFPLVFAVHTVFTVSVVLVLSMVNLFYRDVKYLLEVLVMVWMFASAVVYPVHLVGGRLAFWLQLNPLTVIIDAYRSIILLNTVPPLAPFLGVTMFSLALLLLCWLVFHRSEYTFAENV
jgi:lipopolysaccharide transport system permease protein